MQKQSANHKGRTTQVLMIIDRLTLGGAQMVVLNLCKAFRTKGCEVVLVSLSEENTLDVPDGVRFLTAPFASEGLVQKFQRYGFHARVLDELLEQHGIERPDLTIAHLYKSHMVISRSRHLSRHAYLCIHSNPELELVGKRNLIGRYLRKRRLKRLYSGRVVTVSEALKTILVEKLSIRPEALIAIPNPFDIEAIHRLMVEAIEPEYHGAFVHVSRLQLKPKRHDRLLEYFKDSGVAQKLLLIGEGGDRARIQSLIDSMGLQERVLLLGKQDNPYKYIQKAKATLLTSDYEGFPLVLVESLICGTPAVSLDCPTGPSEILTGSLSQDLVPFDDKQRFIERLRYYSANDVRVADDIAERYSLDAIGQRYLDLIDSSHEA